MCACAYILLANVKLRKASVGKFAHTCRLMTFEHVHNLSAGICGRIYPHPLSNIRVRSGYNQDTRERMWQDSNN